MGEQMKAGETSADNYEQSYAGQLRKLVGNRKLITPGARAVIQDEEGHVLFVRRKDDDKWGMPAGALELGESILDCLKREVLEETGLEVVSATPIAIYSEPRFAFTNAYGGEHQMLAIVFLIDEWRRSLVKNTDETTDAKFFSVDDLPDTSELYRETIQDLREYDGDIIVK
jgi:ADP-ribose pyrophosphatase YjhB (NUDIX family)